MKERRRTFRNISPVASARIEGAKRAEHCALQGCCRLILAFKISFIIGCATRIGKRLTAIAQRPQDHIPTVPEIKSENLSAAISFAASFAATGM